ncbi:hypothetical protein, partial [Neoroseomonas alkaliterrae]|uniref:hypothetical protein n=1 Tax=Neoroseomonas alkaliterrae TaxID=1452450 RepID=UPI0038D05BCD
MRTAFGDISSSSIMIPSAGTKLRARAPVDHTTSTVRAVRSTVAGAVMARCATSGTSAAVGAAAGSGA